MKVLFKRIQAGAVKGSNPLRTEEVKGVLLEPIEVGKGVKVMGESLTPGLSARLVWTSDVTKMEVDDKITRVHATSGSIYEIETV